MLNPYYEYWSIDRPHYDEQRQVMIDIAREKSGYDIDFLSTIECESNRQRDGQPQIRNIDGVPEESYGYCLWNGKYHADIIDHPRFQNKYRQLDQCLDYYHQVRKAGTIADKLYGYNVREDCKPNFSLGVTYTLQDMKKEYLTEVKSQ